jgi:hypothetical protein
LNRPDSITCPSVPRISTQLSPSNCSDSAGADAARGIGASEARTGSRSRAGAGAAVLRAEPAAAGASSGAASRAIRSIPGRVATHTGTRIATVSTM